MRTITPCARASSQPMETHLRTELVLTALERWRSASASRTMSFTTAILGMRAARTATVCISGRGQDDGLQLHRRLVQSSAPPFRHRLSIAQRLRDNHGQPNRNDLSDKPSTEPGQLQQDRLGRVDNPRRANRRWEAGDRWVAHWLLRS